MFKIHSHDTAGRQPWEYLNASAGTYKAGQALALNGGLCPIDEQMKTTPPYICMADITLVTPGVIPVIHVSDRIVFATELSADLLSTEIGGKLAVSAGGLQVSEAGGAGTFELIDTEGDSAGSVVYGRFV